MNAQTTLVPSGNGAFFQISPRGQVIVFLIGAFFSLTPWISAPEALLLGLLVAWLAGHPFAQANHRFTQWLLQFSVVGLGFGMDVHTALQAGRQGVLLTAGSIVLTLSLGLLLGKWLGIEKKIAHLIACGTAICGGSAIVAVAPVVKAEEKQISVALGCVFILNAVALFVFPAVGRYLHLNETQFGLWCAIAIHDTSSVVGAAGKYGAHALEIATTVKLARALWIIPVALLSALSYKTQAKKVRIPWFIGLFVGVLLLNTYVPGIKHNAHYITNVAKAGLTLTLFLIGAGLSRGVLASVGFKPLLQSVLLWLFISVISLFVILHTLS